MFSDHGVEDSKWVRGGDVCERELCSVKTGDLGSWRREVLKLRGIKKKRKKTGQRNPEGGMSCESRKSSSPPKGLPLSEVHRQGKKGEGRGFQRRGWQQKGESVEITGQP